MSACRTRSRQQQWHGMCEQFVPKIKVIIAGIARSHVSVLQSISNRYAITSITVGVSDHARTKTVRGTVCAVVRGGSDPTTDDLKLIRHAINVSTVWRCARLKQMRLSRPNFLLAIRNFGASIPALRGGPVA